MERIMGTLHFAKKGKQINSLKKFQIYFEIIINNPANEESTTGYNKIYGVDTQHEGQTSILTTVHVFRLPVNPQIAANKHRCTTTTTL
jgi:hypothetical protein